MQNNLATGHTTRLLRETARRVPLDTTGWRACGILLAGILLALAVQAGLAWLNRPQHTALAAQPLTVKRAPVVVFQTVAAPTPTPAPMPTPQIVYVDRVVEVPVIAPAVVQPIHAAPPPAAPAPAPPTAIVEPDAPMQLPNGESMTVRQYVQLNDPAQNGGNVAPDDCPFPIINGMCANGRKIKN